MSQRILFIHPFGNILFEAIRPAKIPLTRNILSLILEPAVIKINDIKKIAFR